MARSCGRRAPPSDGGSSWPWSAHCSRRRPLWPARPTLPSSTSPATPPRRSTTPWAGERCGRPRSLPDARWPAARTVGKVTGRDLAGAGAGTHRRPAARRLAPAGGGRAGGGGRGDPRPVDAGGGGRAWPRAMDQLGGDARRVIFYAAPSLVERVGRADPRRPLDPALAGLVDAMSRGRATYLLTYRGDLSAFPAREMATHPTRWPARWPAGRGELRLMLGVGRGHRPGASCGRARARPRPAARCWPTAPPPTGCTTPPAGGRGPQQYRSFLASPDRLGDGRRLPGADARRA